jgi:hypothetical protein
MVVARRDVSPRRERTRLLGPLLPFQFRFDIAEPPKNLVDAVGLGAVRAAQLSVIVQSSKSLSINVHTRIYRVASYGTDEFQRRHGYPV